MSESFLAALEKRRTYYQLTAKSTIPDAKIEEIVKTAVKHVPSAFNIQTGRVVVVLGEANQKVWSIVKDGYLASLNNDEAMISLNTKKMQEYSAGYGTILIFEDQAILSSMNEKMPYFKASNSFEIWSENSTGMLQ
jgi:predicted oxidoreductase (fatty acid repression mutant protein)